MSSYSFQYVSDIHLEFYKDIPSFLPAASNLILAGDIGNPYSLNYRDFLVNVSRNFGHIFLISGNHEYYKHSEKNWKRNIPEGKTTIEVMNEIDNHIREITKPYSNIHFLQNESFHFPNSELSIFGGTFWTNIPRRSYLAVERYINDYNAIPGFTPDVSNELHAAATAALESEIQKNPGRKWIVISHHMPKNWLIVEKYQNCQYNAAFASDIEIADSPEIVAWIYGHTHTPSIQNKYYCNPIGYPRENPETVIDFTRSIIVDTSEKECENA